MNVSKKGNFKIEDITVVIAAGGKGSRIRSVASDIPKPMIPIAGKPVLEWEIESLHEQGFKKIILTVSHLADKIIGYFADGSKWGINITYYNEAVPLGNAGALFKLWEDGRLSDTFLFLIADAVFDVSFTRMFSFHQERDALATLFTHPNSHPYDSGLVMADKESIVTDWINKEDEKPEFYKNRVNAGLHILTTELLKQSRIDPAAVGVSRKADLDRDVLKPLISTRRIVAYDSPEFCRDMGVPERFYAVCRDVESGLVKARNFSNPQRAVFLDRDGTINRYTGFVRNINDFELLPHAAEAIKLLNSRFLVIVVTNQPVIARGEVTIGELQTIHNKMETLLGKSGAYVDGLYYCPHHPDRGYEGEISSLKIECPCRKPKPGLLLRAAEEYNISLADSWMVGDSWRDIGCGRSAGTRTILLTGAGTESRVQGQPIHHSHGDRYSDEQMVTPDYEVPDLLSAVKIILGA